MNSSDMANLVLEKSGTLGVELDSTMVVTVTMTVLEMITAEVELRATEVELDTPVDRGILVDGNALDSNVLVPSIGAL
jgi:hypothetical protein